VREFTQVCDGLLVIGDGREQVPPLGSGSLAALSESGTPCVFVDCAPRRLPAVQVDRGAGVAEAVAALAPDYDRFVLLITADFPEDDRVRAFKRELSRAGKRKWLSVLRGAERPPALGAETGYEMAGAIPRGDGRTLVMCRDDRVALGLLRGLYELGVAVPAGVGVLGFDDDSYAPFTAPPLSTVAQPTRELAEKSVERLVALVDGEEYEGPAVLGTRFVQRAST
jgi:DNA-binding LacI/PurR family transcriptional regulator